jgi:hypothetical protein
MKFNNISIFISKWIEEKSLSINEMLSIKNECDVSSLLRRDFEILFPEK